MPDIVRPNAQLCNLDARQMYSAVPDVRERVRAGGA
jgi:hypothetical protein